MHDLTTHSLLSILPLVICYMLLDGIVANAGELPSAIQEQLEKNAASLGPLKVSWTRRRHSDLEPTRLMTIVKLPAYYKFHFFEDETTTFCFQDGMTYLRTEGKMLSNPPEGDEGRMLEKPILGLEVTEVCCDLSRVYVGTGQEAIVRAGLLPSLVIYSLQEPKIHKPDSPLFTPVFLNKAGYWFPEALREMGQQPTHLILHLLNSGFQTTDITETIVDDIECIRITLESKEAMSHFFLDPQRSLALIRREMKQKPNGETLQIESMTGFSQELDTKLWLPKRCTTEYYVWGSGSSLSAGHPLVLETHSLVELDQSAIPLEQFVLRYTTPGTRVTDSTLPESKQVEGGLFTYRIPADLSRLDEVIRETAEGRTRPRSITALLIAANLLVVLVLLVLLLLKRKRT